jgi:hypothetical protein
MKLIMYLLVIIAELSIVVRMKDLSIEKRPHSDILQIEFSKEDGTLCYPLLYCAPHMAHVNKSRLELFT